MNKRKLLSALSLVLVFCMLLGVGPITPVAFAAETIASSVTDNGGHSQTHTAGTNLAAIQAQNSKWAAQTFLNQCAVALDGSNGNPDLCIPGLSSTDNMIPQGMTWYKAKDWALIASYSHVSGKPSVIYALDINTGKFVAQFNLKNTDGSNCTEHVGGIAASDYNLYITTSDNKIGYVPLSELEVSEGTVKDIKIVEEVSIAELGGASTSYVSIDKGVLWTGNFYLATNASFNKKANSSYNSLAFGYYLNGATPETEWNFLKTGSVSGTAPSEPENCVGHPTYTVAIPNDIDRVQCALVANGRIYLGCSYGRKNASQLYIADVDLTSAGTIPLTVNGVSVNAYDISSYTGFDNHLYMNEGMFERDNEIYVLTESAAYYYYGEETSKCPYPTDVIWRLDPYALMGESAPIDSESTSYYQKVSTWDQINSGDEYIILYQSTVKDATTGNNILYALNARGGYNDTALPRYTVRSDATQQTTGDSMGMIGHAITDYSFANGNNKLVLNNSEDDIDAIRWKIDKNDQTSTGKTGGGVRITSTDEYFSNAPYLYYGSRLIYMTYGANSQFENVYLSNIDEANGTFKLYYNGSNEYWMFCNDGTIGDAINNYTNTYVNNVNSRSYQLVYENATELPGTFHMDGGANRAQSDTGNMVGGTDSKKAVDASYGYFNIYKRIIKEASSGGKSNLFTGKKAYASADGTYSIDLEAYATGETQSAIVSSGTPLDVVMVIDSSSSMSKDKDCTNYDKNFRLTYDSTDGNCYYKIGNTYYPIQKGSYPTTEWTAYTHDLSWKNCDGVITRYYMLDGKPYEIKRAFVKKDYKFGDVSAYFRCFLYIVDDDGYIWLLYTGDDCKNGTNHSNATHPAHNSGYTSLNDIKYTTFDDVNSPIYYCSRRESRALGTNNPSDGNNDTIYSGVDYEYTDYTHYYLYFVQDGVTYYLDGNKVTATCPAQYHTSSEYIWIGDYYKTTSVQRQTALVKSMNEFVDELRVDSGKYDIDHRISFVTFGNDDSNALPTADELAGLVGIDYDYKYTGVWQQSDATTGAGSIVKKNTSGITSAYQTALYSANSSTVDKAIATINDMDDSYVCAAPNHGLEMAYNILANSDARQEYIDGTRKAIVIFVTDGVPGNPDRSDNPRIAKIYANAAIQQASRIETLGFVDIYSIYMGNETMSGFSVEDYMNGVSSNYPYATGYPGYSSTDENGVAYTGELGKREANTFYANFTTGGDLTALFSEISYEAIASGTSVNLDSKAVLKDVLSDKFTFPENLSNLKVTLKTQELYYDPTTGKLVEGDITESPAGITYKLANNNEINVTGFDYSTYYVAPDHAGKRLIVNIEGILPNGDVSGYGINTNDNERSGIYANPDSTDPEQLLAEDVTKLLPAPDTDIPTFNYVFDYSSEMPITAISNQLLAVSEKPGKLDVTDYQSEAENAVGGKANLISNTNVNLTTGSEDSYLYCFMKTNEEGVYQWAKVNLIPASNVYFEETALQIANGWSPVGTASTETQAVSSNNDIYGYDDSYNKVTDTFSGGSAYKALVDSTTKRSDAVSFSFTGESFDLISACGPNTGMFAVKVSMENASTDAAAPTYYYIVDTYYSDTAYLLDGNLMYNVPVMRFEGAYGKYKVEINALYAKNAGAVKNAKSGGVSALSLDDGAASSLDSMLKAAGLDEFVGKNVETVWMDDNSVLNGGTGNTGSQSTRPFSWLKAARGAATLAEEVVPQQLEVYLDAIRIYKPYGSEDPTQYATSERSSQYINVLNALKNNGGTASTTEAEKSVFYYEQTGVGEDAVFSFNDYENSLFGGPQNEIYLKAGQGITFSLNDYDPEKSAVMIALRRIKSNSSTGDYLPCTVNASDLEVASTNEIYYNLSAVVGGDLVGGAAGEDDPRAIAIKNNSTEGDILAISYIKLVDATIATALDLNEGEAMVQAAYSGRSVSFNPFEVYNYSATGNEDESFNDNNIPSIVDMSLFEEIIAMLEKIFKLIFGISTIVK